MRTIWPFEATLLRILHATVGRAPAEGVIGALMRADERPPGLSADALALIRETLAKGCVAWLANHGGWKVARSLRGEKAVSGRLWERSRPEELSLTFSTHSLELLVRLTAEPMEGLPQSGWELPEDELTLGDRFLLFLVHEAFGETEAGRPLRRWASIARHGLCRLARPQLPVQRPEMLEVLPELTPWLDEGAWILEVLQDDLAARWSSVEQTKGRYADPEPMRRIGQSQDMLLEAFLAGIEQRDRPDLARFLLRAGLSQFSDPPDPAKWIGSLQVQPLRLAERAQVYQAALGLARGLGRIRHWRERGEGIGYFDEGYAASQLLKAEWEDVDGDRLIRHTAELSRALDPIGTTASG